VGNGIFEITSFFLPQDDPSSCRSDDIHVLDLAKEKGWKVGTHISELGDAVELPYMQLFASDHMDYEIDRDPEQQPSLREMALKALDTLERSSRSRNTGYFLMIEGSRIDMAAHSNNPAAHVHDIFAYNDAVQAMLEHMSSDTVLISVSDHETGGLSVAHQLNSTYPEYQWYPEYLLPVRHSGEYIAKQLLTQKVWDRHTFVTDIVMKQWLGIQNPKPEDVAFLLDPSKTFTELDYHVGKITSDLANVGWSTHGHSAVDVNLYGRGPGIEVLKGNHENTEIGAFIARVLKLDLDSITKRLNKGSV
jgi:alkaline phosphatase